MLAATSKAVSILLTSNASSHARLADLTSMAISTTDNANLKTQREIEAAWNKLVATYAGTVHVLPSIEDAVAEARKTPSVNVLVTGSLHLVGGVIEVAGLADRALRPKI